MNRYFRIQVSEPELTRTELVMALRAFRQQHPTAQAVAMLAELITSLGLHNDRTEILDESFLTTQEHMI